MSIKDFFIAKGHTEPLGRLDLLDGRTEPPNEDFAAESRAEVSKPKGGRS